MPAAAVAVGTSALVILVIVTITGGFAFDAGALHVSAHNWRTPLVVALIAFGVGAVFGRAACADAGTALWQFVNTHALVGAIALAAAAAAVGIAYGTFSASSSDASGYVSESRLLASGRLADEEPLARGVAWPNATWAFSPLGYRPGSQPGELVPTYPAGLPLAMAAARLIGGELAAYFVVPLLGAVTVLAAYGIGARLHSRIAGLAAALLLASSPIVLFQIVQPMSDVAVTAWWALALLFAVAPLPSGPLAAGATAGLAVLTRPNLLPLAIVPALAVSNWPRFRRPHDETVSARRAPIERRARPDRLIGFVAGIAPAIGAQLLMQWQLYGSPIRSGYGAAGDLYALSGIVPNAFGYARRMIHGEGPALVLGLVALAIVAAPRFRSWHLGGHALNGSEAPPLNRSIVLAGISCAIVLASYLPYGVFAEWSYLRFLLPSFPLLFVLIGALLSHALSKCPPPIRATTLLCALAIAASINIVRARDEQAFAMRRYESRYRTAGLYLASALPSNAVIVTVQESGSARYYTRRPILRWDQLDVDLDTAIAAVRALRRHPVLLIEDWERAEIAKKHPQSTNAHLDWRPRAEFGDETRVFLYDPLDRGTQPSWDGDRVH